MARGSLSRQRGFTLIEMMASIGGTAIIIAAATAFLLRFIGWYSELSARIAMNRHARETYELLAYGGQSRSTGNDGTTNLYGLRGIKRAPPGLPAKFVNTKLLTPTRNGPPWPPNQWAP